MPFFLASFDCQIKNGTRISDTGICVFENGGWYYSIAESLLQDCFLAATRPTKQVSRRKSSHLSWWLAGKWIMPS